MLKPSSAALVALREQRATLALAAKMAGELEGPRAPTTTILWGFDESAFPPVPGEIEASTGTNGTGEADVLPPVGRGRIHRSSYDIFMTNWTGPRGRHGTPDLVGFV